LKRKQELFSMKPIVDRTNNSSGHHNSKISTNPYQPRQAELPFDTGGSSTLEVLKREVDDLVKLELTAEQMVREEVDLAKTYMREDAHSIWADLKLGLQEWELITGDWLLRAADPTRVDWQLHHWWGDDETHLH
jgi:hypothetical protein